MFNIKEITGKGGAEKQGKVCYVCVLDAHLAQKVSKNTKKKQKGWLMISTHRHIWRPRRPTKLVDHTLRRLVEDYGNPIFLTVWRACGTVADNENRTVLRDTIVVFFVRPLGA